MVEARPFCRMNNSEVVQRSLKRTWNLLATRPGTCTRTLFEVKGTCVQASDKFFRLFNWTTSGKVVASRSDCDGEDRKSIVDEAHLSTCRHSFLLSVGESK